MKTLSGKNWMLLNDVVRDVFIDGDLVCLWLSDTGGLSRYSVPKDGWKTDKNDVRGFTCREHYAKEVQKFNKQLGNKSPLVVYYNDVEKGVCFICEKDTNEKYLEGCLTELLNHITGGN